MPKLTQQELSQIKDFAAKVGQARVGRDRANNDQGNHRILREITGKVGEVGARKELGYGAVDFTVYKGTKTLVKNTAFDLAPNIHVKTCNLKYRATKYDGFLVGLSDSIVKAPQKEDKIILVYADESGNYEVVGYVYVSEVAHLYKPPVNTNLLHKIALYTKDIEDYVRPIEEIIGGRSL